MSADFVIVGGGQAAASAAARLRELDDDIQITMLCGEDVLPYQRPPLSKKYLSGEMPLDRLILRPQSWYDEQRVVVKRGCFVQDILRRDKRAVLADGSHQKYDKLLLVTGSVARQLPEETGADAEGVHYLRAAVHADNMRPLLGANRKLVVIGGGYIGLEVAAIAAQSDMQVTLIEAAERILQRVASPLTSDYFRNLHRQHGVDILESTAIEKIMASNGTVSTVRIADGKEIDCDMVLIGIGVLPQTTLAHRCGLEVDNGIAVDTRCRTSDVDIFAAGDCTSFEYRGQRIRLESVPNAIHQAEVAAENMLGGRIDYVATPWFWSDQFDVKLQIAGLNAGYDATVRRPGRRAGSQSVWYYRGEQLLAVDAMNDAPAFMTARRLLESGLSLPKKVAEDATANLKEWMNHEGKPA